MSDTRQRKGFQRLGAIPLGREAGLSAARERDLRLQRAWLVVAGTPLADRVRAVRVRRGVLELAVDDPRWRREVIALIPHLAARLATSDPGLGVRKFRILGENGRPGSEPLPPVEREDPPAGSDSGLSGDSPEPARSERPDIEEIARRYLDAR